jgi:hypothetical protein
MHPRSFVENVCAPPTGEGIGTVLASMVMVLGEVPGATVEVVGEAHAPTVKGVGHVHAAIERVRVPRDI